MENLDVDGNILLRLTSKLSCEGADYIHLAQDRDRRRALVNAAMNILVPSKDGNFLIS